MEVCPYSSAQEHQWDTFVSHSRNGTFFHTQKFLAYHPSGKFVDASLMFYDGIELIAVLSAVSVEEDGERFLVSHPGASYGGLAFSFSHGMKETGEVVDALMAYAKDQKYAGIRFLRLTPPSVRRGLCDDQEYWLFQRGWRPFRVELATSLPLWGMRETGVLESFSGKCRNMVHQAQRAGVEFKETHDFASFWPLLEKILSERHGSKPTHDLDEISRLHELCLQDVRLFGAYHGEKMVAGVVGIVLHPKALYTLYMAQDYTYQSKHPLHLIIAELASLCIREGRKILHFGISTEEGGTKVNEGLFFFKESFGGQSVRRESWEVLF